MVGARCDCGAVRIAVEAPEEIWTCRCTICRKLWVLWAYYSPEAVRVVAEPGATDVYSAARAALSSILPRLRLHDPTR